MIRRVRGGALLMVSGRGVSTFLCAAVGLACVGSVFRSHRGDEGAAVAVPPPAAGTAAPAPAAALPRAEAPRAAAAAAPDPGVDGSLPTGSVAPGSALHTPNPAAYKGAAKMGDPVTVTGAEAINYLTGNTLRAGGAGAPARLTYFAPRGLMGEGDERAFTARRWDRERSELCGPGPDGAALCRSVSILLDGKYEFPGARLGTVTLGAAGGAAPVTAELVKGDALRFPDHIPFLDSSVGSPADAAPAPRDPLEALAGHAVSVQADGGRGRGVAFYARDSRLLDVRQVQDGAGVAVEVEAGHWRAAKAGLCQAAGAAPQACYRVEPAPGGARLVPAGKGGEAQLLMVLPEAGARDVAQR